MTNPIAIIGLPSTVINKGMDAKSANFNGFGKMYSNLIALITSKALSQNNNNITAKNKRIHGSPILRACFIEKIIQNTATAISKAHEAPLIALLPGFIFNHCFLKR